MSSWGEAHQDLLNQFGVGNPIFRSGAAARGVNNHWRSSYPSYEEGAFSQENPWLLYRDMGSGEIRLYDVVRERIHQRMVGALEGASFLGSTLGWVVMVEGFEVDIRPYRKTAH
ncbi:hypothetical protein ISN44_As06g042810 [Arabidopsis suecica]|uniref:Uncharacterized protein n=1 Tax=Arabidopsis suecica TaxID=45249 RepID=A0A8T2CRA1_ARASU|nr:hypothetical protein ISN44_As06g042810 [Arabidopsis suecica]